MSPNERIDKLIDIIYENVSELEKRCDAEQLNATYAISEFAEVKHKVSQHIKTILKSIPKWISVDDRLPDDDVNVLVFAPATIGDDAIAMTSYTHNMHGYNIEGWRSPWQYFFYDHTITHWMPLPEPPKE